SPPSALCPSTTLFRSLPEVRRQPRLGNEEHALLLEHREQRRVVSSSVDANPESLLCVQLGADATDDLAHHVDVLGPEGAITRTKDRKSTRLNSSHVKI